MKRASRIVQLPPYPFARWASHVESARQSGADVIRLDIGNPDLAPPEDVIEELCSAARRPDSHGYCGYRGIPALREAMAGYYERRFGVALDPRSAVIPLIGSKEGIVNLALACLDTGDLALVPNPGYAAYVMGAALAGAQVYRFPLNADKGYLPDLEAIPADVAARASLVWLNYPNNPTGATADLAFLGQAVSYARRHDLLLCHDAPYSDVTYEGYVAPSILQVPGAADVAIEFNSLSKTTNMAGWRIGMAVGNSAALEALAQVKSNVDSGLFRPLQEAAVKALATGDDWVAARNEVFHERLEILVEALNGAGFEARCPLAALYVWAEIPERLRETRLKTAELPSATDSERFALNLLRQTGVAVAPGSFFGSGGEHHVRISITVPTDRVRQAASRLLSFAASA
jgi:LL-diaminopimelate aminotransferase